MSTSTNSANTTPKHRGRPPKKAQRKDSDKNTPTLTRNDNEASSSRTEVQAQEATPNPTMTQAQQERNSSKGKEKCRLESESEDEEETQTVELLDQHAEKPQQTSPVQTINWDETTPEECLLRRENIVLNNFADFKGKEDENIHAWLAKLQVWIEGFQLLRTLHCKIIALKFQRAAATWLQTLPYFV